MTTAPFLAAQRRRPGSRGRIGVIQPAPGVTLEMEWPEWLPPDVLFPVGRIPMTGADKAGYDAIAARVPDVARSLASANATVIAFACTVGSLYAGPAAETALLRAMEEATGRPAISLAATCANALRHVGAHRPAIMTPYNAETNGWVGDYIEAQGFSVAGFIPTPVSILDIDTYQPAEIAAIAIAALANMPAADALWIPCTAIQTMKAIAMIEAATGLPVVSGTQALLWRALDIMQVRDPVIGAGSLFL